MKPHLTTIARASLMALFSLGLGAAHAQTHHAQPASTSAAPSAHAATLPPVIVNAKPVIEEVRVDAFSNVSAIITEDQLRDQNAIDLTSALRRTPGVQTSRFNPVGAFGGTDGGGVFIRGMGASRPGGEVTTSIDGVPFYMGVWNHPLLDLLPINGMQSIAVQKSPQPSTGGGNHFASVDLKTRRATEEGVHGDARITAGSFNTFTEQINLLGKHGDLDWMLAHGHAQSKGHRANARGRLNNIMGHVGLRMNENWSGGVSFLAVDNKSRDPGDERLPAPAKPQEFNTQGSTFSFELAHQHGHWQGGFKVFSSQGKGSWLNQPADGDTISKFKMAGVRWKEQFSPWKGGTITAGMDYDQVSGKVHFNRTPPKPQTTFDTPTFRLVSPYVALSQQIELGQGWSLLPSAGVRFYNSNQFDSEWAPHAGVSLMSDKFTVFANASRGIHYPGLETATLASLIPPLRTSWKQLQAEKMDHVEVGFKFAPTAATQIDASVFRDKVKNRYVFGFPPNVAPPPKFLNLGAYHVKGAEFAIRQDVGEHWSIFAGLTVLDPSISHLPYAPKRALTAGVNGRIGPVRLALDAQHQSQTYVFSNARRAGSTNTETVPGFTVANMRVSYPIPALGKKGEVFATVENLFNKKYAYRPGYPMPGRSGQVGLAASF